MCFSSVYSVYLLYKLKKCRKHLPAYRALLWTKFSIWIDASWTKLIYIINFQFVLLPITIINLTKYWCIHVRSFVCKNAPFMWLMFSTFSLVFSNTHHVLSQCNTVHSSGFSILSFAFPPHSSVDGHHHNSSVQSRPARDNSKYCLLLVYLYCFVINLSFIYMSNFRFSWNYNAAEWWWWQWTCPSYTTQTCSFNNCKPRWFWSSCERYLIFSLICSDSYSYIQSFIYFVVLCEVLFNQTYCLT